MTDLKIGGGVPVPSGTPTRPGASEGASGGVPGPGANAGAASGAAGASFAERLTGARRQQLDAALSALIDKVRSEGRDFLRDPDERHLGRYRQAVRDFLGRVRIEAFALREEPGLMRDGQQKLYELVATADAEIAGLTRETLAEQDRPLRLLASLDEIRGLILDFLV